MICASLTLLRSPDQQTEVRLNLLTPAGPDLTVNCASCRKAAWPDTAGKTQIALETLPH